MCCSRHVHIDYIYSAFVPKNICSKGGIMNQDKANAYVLKYKSYIPASKTVYFAR